jgi:hypothetical protein
VGIAVVLSHPFAALALTASRQSRGFELVLGGTEGWINYVIVLMVMSFATAVLLTTLSAVGAGLRILLDHLRRERPGTAPRDVRSRYRGDLAAAGFAAGSLRPRRGGGRPLHA